MHRVHVLTLFMLLQNALSENCTTPNGEAAECIQVRNCTIFVNTILDLEHGSVEFIKKSQCGYINGSPLVCCGSTATSAPETSTVKVYQQAKLELLPSRRYCGYQHSDDYFHNADGNATSIHEFPWLAALIYNEENRSSVVKCSGSLITNRYVLTAAQCIITTRVYELIKVRLGEYNIDKTEDCVKSGVVEEECTDKVVDYGIEKKIKHENFDTKAQWRNDIGLIRLDRTVIYSDYVRPICLPFPGTQLAQYGDKLSSSGWGLSKVTTTQAVVKKKILSTLIPVQRCIDEFRLRQKIINLNHTCTLDEQNVAEVICRGDNGGPLMFSNTKNQWHQEGIISFGEVICGSTKPYISTNVVKYLDWILDHIN